MLSHKVFAPDAASAAYKAGYRKPPQASQFKPGVSGNPKGRPKGARNKLPALNEERLKTILIEEAYRDVKVKDGKREIKMSIARTVVRSISMKAASGKDRAQKLFVEMLSETERSYKHMHNEYLRVMIDYKADWDRELEDRKVRGVSGPEPLPHPDDIVIDMKTGEVHVKGPFTKEEKIRWAKLSDRVDQFESEIEVLTDLLKDPEMESSRDIIEQDIAEVKHLRDRVMHIVGAWRARTRGGKSQSNG